MKVLIYRWKAYNYMDIIAEFDALGIRVDIIKHDLKKYDDDEEFIRMMISRLEETAYDFVFTVNYFAVIAEACHAVGVPYCVWTCDNPLISLYHESAFYDENRIFTFDRSNYHELKLMGIKNVWYLPLAAGQSRIDNAIREMDADVSEDMSEQERSLRLAGSRNRYIHDVSFVGSLYEKNSYDAMESFMPDYLRGYLDGVINAQLNVSGGNIIEPMLTPDIMLEVEKYFRLEKSEKSFSNLPLIFSTTVLGFKVAAQMRVQCLNALSKRMDVAVYSNSDTSQIPLCKGFGSVDYWTMLPVVFKKSKINLNFTIPNIKSGVPLRVWDVLSSGGFLMTNFTAELLDFFEPDKEIVIFESERELVEKCAYYLEHEDERERIAVAGYEKVRTRHTLKSRVEKIIGCLYSERQK